MLVCVYSFRWTGSSEQPPKDIMLEVKRPDEMQISSSLQSPLSTGAFTNILWALGFREHPWQTTALGDSQGEGGVGKGWPTAAQPARPTGLSGRTSGRARGVPAVCPAPCLCVASQRHMKTVLLHVVTSRKLCPSVLSALIPFPLANTPPPQH